MVGVGTEPRSLNKIDFAIAGAGSGVITRVFCQPFDVLKIRFQLQVEPISKTSTAKYRSLGQAVALIAKEEGVKSLWKGHMAGQMLSIFYGIGQFLSFEIFTAEAAKLSPETKFNPLTHFTCGVLAGATATIISFPFDFVRTRMVAQSEAKKAYATTMMAFIKACKHEGFLVLFRGLYPTVLQIAPQAGVQFMCFRWFDRTYKEWYGIKETRTTVVGSLISGGLAGLIAKTIVYPLDVVKKRLQIQGFEQNRKDFGKVFKCSGFNDCLVKTYKVEGIVGFFKGMYPSIIKAVLTTSLHFTMYELICKEIAKMKKAKRRRES